MIIQFSQPKLNKINPNYPENWKLLNHDDLRSYFDLQFQFQQETTKSPKGKRLDSFKEKLDKTKKFIEKGDGEDWKRSIVCGIFFCDVPDYLAIQIQQFKLLIGKCKSSINGSFQQLGYVAQPQLEQEFLSKKIPLQYRKATDFKKWSVRQKIRNFNLKFNSNSWKTRQLISVSNTVGNQANNIVDNPIDDKLNRQNDNTNSCSLSYSNSNLESNLEDINKINEKNESKLFFIELPASCFYRRK